MIDTIKLQSLIDKKDDLKLALQHVQFDIREIVKARVDEVAYTYHSQMSKLRQWAEPMGISTYLPSTAHYVDDIHHVTLLNNGKIEVEVSALGEDYESCCWTLYLSPDPADQQKTTDEQVQSHCDQIQKMIDQCSANNAEIRRRQYEELKREFEAPAVPT